VLTELGFASGVSAATFNYYIKSLRKFGVPFGRSKKSPPSHKLALYSYDDLMELSLALTLRVYGWLPDPVADGLIRFREKLHPLYADAYFERKCGRGCPVRIYGPKHESFDMAGIYLDLQVHYSAGRLIDFGPPIALSPYQALKIFAYSNMSARAHLPLNLSALAARVVECALIAPDIRRGPAARCPSANRNNRSRDLTSE